MKANQTLETRINCEGHCLAKSQRYQMPDFLVLQAHAWTHPGLMCLNIHINVGGIAIKLIRKRGHTGKLNLSFPFIIISKSVTSTLPTAFTYWLQIWKFALCCVGPYMSFIRCFVVSLVHVGVLLCHWRILSICVTFCYAAGWIEIAWEVGLKLLFFLTHQEMVN